MEEHDQSLNWGLLVVHFIEPYRLLSALDVSNGHRFDDGGLQETATGPAA